MKIKARSIDQIVEEQVHRWQIFLSENTAEVTPALVISISREPGSGGRILAQNIVLGSFSELQTIEYFRFRNPCPVKPASEF
jgi:hypothetical protein